jgi:hypothetical protein
MTKSDVENRNEIFNLVGMRAFSIDRSFQASRHCGEINDDHGIRENKIIRNFKQNTFRDEQVWTLTLFLSLYRHTGLVRKTFDLASGRVNKKKKKKKSNLEIRSTITLELVETGARRTGQLRVVTNVVVFVHLALKHGGEGEG